MSARRSRSAAPPRSHRHCSAGHGNSLAQGASNSTLNGTLLAAGNIDIWAGRHAALGGTIAGKAMSGPRQAAASTDRRNSLRRRYHPCWWRHHAAGKWRQCGQAAGAGLAAAASLAGGAVTTPRRDRPGAGRHQHIALTGLARTIGTPVPGTVMIVCPVCRRAAGDALATGTGHSQHLSVSPRHPGRGPVD